MAEFVFFILFAIGALAGAIGVLLFRSPVNSAISLVMSFFFVAGLYVLLHATFMGVIQVLVYAGAIMVLFVFVLMLLNFRDDDVVDAKLGMHQLVAVLMGIAMLLIIVPAILTTFFAQTGVATETMPQGFGEVAGIGRALTTTFVLPFELAAVLLLTGIVSAMVIAKKRV